MVESVPFNGRGDRLLIPGEAGGIEKFQQHRARQAKIQAENRIRDHLMMHCADVLEVMTDEQLKNLLWVVRSLCQQTAKVHREKFIEVVKKAGTFIPAADSVPEIGGEPHLLEFATPEHDPLPIDADYEDSPSSGGSDTTS